VTENIIEKDTQTFVIPAFRTRTCFLGAIVLAPFLGPRTVLRRPEDFAVAVVSFLDLMVPCAILEFEGVQVMVFERGVGLDVC
jgi:hypothetical protein